MFDRLVESTKSRGGKRSGRYFLVTMTIYSVALLGFGVGTVIGFSPVLAEQFDLTAMLAPPPPPGPPAIPPAKITTRIVQVDNTFRPPAHSEIRVLPPSEAGDYPIAIPDHYVAGGIPGSFSGSRTGVPGGRSDVTAPPPPQRELTEPEPPPVPEMRNEPPRRVSEGVLRGIVVRREKPAYPAIARSVKASGPVQVLVTISEEGRVIEASAIEGHPLLRRAAVDAARRWLFTPTRLSKTPVRVQGLLTFNFILE